MHTKMVDNSAVCDQSKLPHAQIITQGSLAYRGIFIYVEDSSVSFTLNSYLSCLSCLSKLLWIYMQATCKSGHLLTNAVYEHTVCDA